MKSLHVVVYTDSVGIGGAEISLGHLIANVSDEIEITVVGTCQTVIDTISDRRPSATRLVLAESFFAHLKAFRRLNPDIIHFNSCTPWANATGIAAALLLPRLRTCESRAVTPKNNRCPNPVAYPFPILASGCPCSRW